MSNGDWSLEVVRGREVGRLYALAPGVCVLGNALRGASGLDLAEQEGNDYRTMDGRQAQLECSAQGLSLRDLDSTNGTFLNRQRLPAGQSRPLHPGDVIQLAGVQLKVVAGAAPRPVAPPQSHPQPAPAPPPPAGAFRFTMATGDECRTWDDFLTTASRRWPALREELVSGRLARFVATVQRPDLTPITTGTPDDRLDAWLGALPTTRPSGPIMDIQPRSLIFRVVPGVGVSRQSVRVANTGNRLLHSTVRIEPAATSWARLPPEFMGGPFVTVDSTELPVEVHFPKVIDRTLTAALVIESNGGLRQVELRLERPPLPAGMPMPEPEPEPIANVSGGVGLGEMVARQPLWLRLAGWAVLGVILRLLVLLGGLILPGESPSLPGAALIFGLIGGCAAAVFALSKRAWTDLPTAAFAGGFAGVLAAAVVVSGCRSLEASWIARLSASPYAGLVLWAALGAALAAVSALLVPHRPTTAHAP